MIDVAVNPANSARSEDGWESDKQLPLTESDSLTSDVSQKGTRMKGRVSWMARHLASFVIKRSMPRLDNCKRNKIPKLVTEVHITKALKWHTAQQNNAGMPGTIKVAEGLQTSLVRIFREIFPGGIMANELPWKNLISLELRSGEVKGAQVL